MPARLTTQQFIDKAKDTHGDRYDYSSVKYTNSNTPVAIGCNVHGVFLQKPIYHTTGSGCPSCGIELTRSINSTGLSTFISRAKLLHNNFYDYSKCVYVNSSVKVCIICPIHGDFNQSPIVHLQGCGCISCRNDKVHTWCSSNTSDFIEKAISIHGDTFDYSLVDYHRNHIPVSIICKTHGVFTQRPAYHLRGGGCSICTTSIGERTCIQILNILDIKYKQQYKFPDCRHKKPLPFDFYLPEHNTCVEFHGKQHYEITDYFGGKPRLLEQIKRDEIKATYCKDNDITLVIIPYWDIDNIHQILSVALYTDS